jgi:nucleotide-binding universal stress UspA family protein
MSYKTLLVHLELDGDNEGVLAITAELAERFNSRVVGIATVQPAMPMFEEGGAMASVVLAEREELDKELENCRVQFKTALELRAKGIEFRSAVLYGSLAEYIAKQARCADLIITRKDIGMSLIDNSRRVNIGDLALTAGRPVLIVPQGTTHLNMRHVFLAWKDTREARRAAVDGLPLMKAAGHVTVLEVTSEHREAAAKERVSDVASWLETHKVSATPMAVGTQSDATGFLRAELLNHKCDLVVAGAYGHNRLGEWVFGGVTCDILLDPDCCVLVAH